jgi:cytidylate kinase
MTLKDTHIVIAIDGPAAAGKGTLSRRLAERYGLRHLDTGLTYRATAKALLDRGLPLDDEDLAAEVARNLDLSGLDRARSLAAHAIGEAASKVAVMPKVRRALVEAQREFAAHRAGRGAGRPRHRHGCLPGCADQVLCNSQPRSAGAAAVTKLSAMAAEADIRRHSL